MIADPAYPAGVPATERERAVVSATVELMKAYGELEREEGASHPSHAHDVVRAVHDVQRIVAMRVARRVDPELWRVGGDVRGAEVRDGVRDDARG